MTRPIFVLASSSPRRLELLKNIGICPDKIVESNIDETPYLNEKPRHLAARLSLEKLNSVSSKTPGGFILAADTVVAVGQRILPKANTVDEVRQFLGLLSGRRHRVHSGVALRTPEGKILRRVSDSLVIFRQLSREDIERYVQTGEGMNKAGGYAIQGKAGAMVRHISGSYSGIVGLPVFEVAQILRGAGWQF